MSFEKFKSKQQAFLLGIILGALLIMIVTVCAFAYHKMNTNEINDYQRFRAVCEQAGGTSISNQFCIRGNEVLVIDINN